MSLAGARRLARRCPAWRRREPGLRLPRGTWEGARRYCGPALGVRVRAGGERERAQAAWPARRWVPRRRALADRLVVVVSPL